MSATTRELSRRRTRVHRTPVVLQMEAVECGAASLAMILAYHGRVVPLTELRSACAVSRDGSNAANLLRAARTYGLEASGYSKDLEGLMEMEGPSIVFWRFNHFLVLEGFRGGNAQLNDPAIGHVEVPLAEFDEGFTGVVLCFQPGPEFVRAGRPPSTVRALRERLQGFHTALTYAVLAGFLLVLPGLAVPALTQVFVDEILIEGRHDWVQALLLGLLAAAVAVGLLRSLQLTVLRRMRLAIAARLSTGFFQHLLRLPVEFYAQRFAGEVALRRRLNERVAAVLSGRLTQTFIDVVMMVFYLFALVLYDLRIALVATISAALQFAALRWLSRRRVEANMRVLQEFGKVSSTSISGLQSMETLKASGLEDGFFRRWSSQFARASNARQEMELANQTLGVLPGFLFGLTNVLVLALGGWSVIQGGLTIGQLIAIQMLTASFLGPVGSLVGLGQTLQELRGDLSRLDDVLDYDTDPQAPEALDSSSIDLGTQMSPRLAGHLEFSSVSFGYSKGAPPLIEDFDLKLAPGRRVALVGGSGSGKSTLAAIAAGLQAPWSGAVLIDGSPRDQLPPERISTSLSWVDQEVVLFAGSVRDNLTLWDDTVPERVLYEALRDAEILDRVQALPGGLDGELEEGGANLSGGERQRLEIARALVGDPSILILDEATSALDAESERAIVERITLRGASCLIVAHRLSTVRDCDEIVLLERGKVMERGTHDELWAAQGAYFELVRLDGQIDGAEAT